MGDMVISSINDESVKQSLMNRQSSETQLEDDRDEALFPRQKPMLKWQDLNQDFYSDSKDFHTITHLIKDNNEKMLDFRPYMIERPFVVSKKDSISKVHMIFRQMHLRQLLVINDDNGKLEGIITRQDIFQYMSL